jgi:hypothetical protein
MKLLFAPLQSKLYELSDSLCYEFKRRHAVDYAFAILIDIYVKILIIVVVSGFISSAIPRFPKHFERPYLTGGRFQVLDSAEPTLAGTVLKDTSSIEALLDEETTKTWFYYRSESPQPQSL